MDANSLVQNVCMTSTGRSTAAVICKGSSAHAKTQTVGDLYKLAHITAVQPAT